jgi:hypothetical protein
LAKDSNIVLSQQISHALIKPFFVANLDYEPNGRQILNSLQEESQSAEEFFQLNLVLIEPRELQHRRP